MSIKERMIQEINGLSQAELEEVAQYLTFVKYQSKFKPIVATDQAQIAAIYAEFAQEDRELAEETISDYADALSNEDTA